MNTFDSLINSFITPTSVSAGVGTVFLSFFTGKIAPKMPKRFYDLLDNNLVRIAIVSFLLNQQIHQPSLAVLIGTIMTLGFELLVKMFAPDTPSLAELVKSTAAPEEEGGAKKSGSSSQQGCNCYCGSTIYTNRPPSQEETKGNRVVYTPQPGFSQPPSPFAR